MIALVAISLSLIYGFLILRHEVKRDNLFWKAGLYHQIKHGKRWRLRAILMSPVVAGLAIGLQPSGWQLLFAPLVSTALVAFAWWTGFDSWFNNIRRFNWWYNGTDDPEDAKTDNILQGMEFWQHIALKLGGTIIFITLYIILLII